MGCHLWNYKRVPKEEIDFESLRIELLKDYEEALHWIKTEAAPNDKDAIEEVEEYIKKIPTLSIEEVWENQSVACLACNGNFYQPVKEFHDIFRVADYPEDVYLTSYEKSLNYYNTNPTSYGCSDNWQERLKEFWNKYPDGLIKFG